MKSVELKWLIYSIRIQLNLQNSTEAKYDYQQIIIRLFQKSKQIPFF